MRTSPALITLLGSVAVMTLYGCKGSSGDGAQASGSGTAQSASEKSLGGIYEGQVTAPSGGLLNTLVLVTEDGRFFIMADDPATNCADVVQGSLNLGGSTFEGAGDFGEINFTTQPAAQVGCTFSDGSVWGNTVMSGSYVPQTTLTLTSTNTTSLGMVMATSTATFTFDSLYNESSDLTKTAGTWSTQTAATWNIDSNGVVYSQDTSTGCILNGQLSVANPLYDLYSVTVTYSNCAGSAVDLNGVTGIGLVALNDQVVPNLLYIGYTMALPSGDSFMVTTVGTR